MKSPGLHDFFLNPIAWFLLLLLIVTAYQNHTLKAQLNAVCDVIEMPHGFQPKVQAESAKPPSSDNRSLVRLAPSGVISVTPLRTTVERGGIRFVDW
jgi:hypothetical protein